AVDHLWRPRILLIDYKTECLLVGASSYLVFGFDNRLMVRRRNKAVPVCVYADEDIACLDLVRARNQRLGRPGAENLHVNALMTEPRQGFDRLLAVFNQVHVRGAEKHAHAAHRASTSIPPVIPTTTLKSHVMRSVITNPMQA